MGGGEGQFTYWIPGHLDNRLGISADVRYGAGTTPVLPNATYNRPRRDRERIAGGVERANPQPLRRDQLSRVWRRSVRHLRPLDEHVSISPSPYPVRARCSSPIRSGNLGCIATTWLPGAPLAAATRLQPGSEVFAIRLGATDLTLEHFGTETRYFSASQARRCVPRRTTLNAGLGIRIRKQGLFEEPTG